MHSVLNDILEVRAALGLSTSAPQLRGILSSVNADTVKIFYDQHRIARGYVLWANVNKESARQFSLKGGYPRHACEWQEGPFVLLLETRIIPGWLPTRHGPLRAFLRLQRTLLFRKKNRVTLYVRRADRLCKKRYFLTPATNEKP